MMRSVLEELKMMNWRISTAILVGCIFGGAIVYGLAFAGRWYFLGVPAGGAVAWFVYVWRDAVEAAPRIWGKLSAWKLDPEIDQLPKLAVASFFIAAATTASFGPFVWWVVDGAVDVTFTVVSVALGGLFFFFVSVAWLSRGRTYTGDDNVVHTITFQSATKDYLTAALHINPIGLGYHMVRLMVWLIVRISSAVYAISRFLLWLFVEVHSKDALDCFIYAATGTLVGALVTQEPTVMIVSAVSGVGLAFLMRLVARVVPEHWYTSA